MTNVPLDRPYRWYFTASCNVVRRSIEIRLCHTRRARPIQSSSCCAHNRTVSTTTIFDFITRIIKIYAYKKDSSCTFAIGRTRKRCWKHFDDVFANVFLVRRFHCLIETKNPKNSGTARRYFGRVEMFSICWTKNFITVMWFDANYYAYMYIEKKLSMQ